MSEKWRSYKSKKEAKQHERKGWIGREGGKEAGEGARWGGAREEGDKKGLSKELEDGLEGKTRMEGITQGANLENG